MDFLNLQSLPYTSVYSFFTNTLTPSFNKAFIMTLESSLISKLKIFTFPLDKAASKRTLLEMLFEPGRFILPTACEF